MGLMSEPDRQILDVSDVQDRLRRFASERDWEKFHTPKNLAMALAAESGELLELFQWLAPEEAIGDADRVKAVADELADIVQYALRLADVLEPSHVTVNPDLVFDHGYAVGDVKYKVFGSDWDRADLYQNIAFATAFGTTMGCVVGFTTGENAPMPPLTRVGQITVAPVAWFADAGAPDEAARGCVDQIARFLGTRSHTHDIPTG